MENANCSRAHSQSGGGEGMGKREVTQGRLRLATLWGEEEGGGEERH